MKRIKEHFDGITLTLALTFALVVAAIAWAGTPPPPYSDPALTTTNALGGVGRTQGFKVTQGTITKDLLADAQIPTDIKTDIEAAAVTSATRFVTVTATCGANASCALDAAEAVCVRLGPSTDSPTLACTAASVSSDSDGGCYLDALEKSCSFTVRPILSCNSYASCHGPLWAKASAGGGNVILHVSVAW